MHGLNPAQTDAVLHRGSSLLVLAGAGSGKTRVVTTRIAKLLIEGVAPENIVGVTFTNKAAKEMRERLIGLVGSERCQGISLSTFHSFCIRVLREHGTHVGLKSFFAIADTADQVAQVIAAAGKYSSVFKSFPPRQVLSQISLFKNKGWLPDQVPNATSELQSIAQSLYPLYQQNLKAMQLVDFDDLLLFTRELLRANREVRQTLQDRIHHLLIDEYQDTNPLQLDLIKLLTAPHCQVCAVGDDDQAIYAFRGANIQNILKFEKDFAPCRVIKLEENYRSHQNILTAAHGVIEKNPHRKGKKLFSSLGDGSPIEVLTCEDGAQEAEQVALSIQQDLEQRGLQAHHIALLYRANPQSRAFEEALRLRAIPYKIVGGTSFFDTKEVKNLLAWISLIDFPNNELSFRRMVNFPPRGVGHVTLERVVKEAPNAQKSLIAFAASGAPGVELKGPAKQSLTAFGAPLLEASRAVAKAHPRQMVGICERAIEEAGYGRWVAEEKDPKIRDRIREAHQGFFDALALFAEQYETAKKTPKAHPEIDTKRPLLRGFLQKLTLEDKDDLRESDKSKTSKGKVTLMSLHAAKGLEFEKVYLVGFEEGLLPHRRSLEESGDSGVQEERRLCYVGITRAKKFLVLSQAEWRRRRHERIKREPSRFLADIPSQTLAQEPLVEETEEETAVAAFASLKARLSKRAPVESPKEIR